MTLYSALIRVAPAVFLAWSLALSPGSVLGQDAAALYDQGVQLQSGSDGIPDLAGARDLFTQAANAGHAPAQNALGRMLYTGLGGAQDRARALALFEAAAAQGAVDHVMDLARAIEADDPARAAELYNQAMQAGSVEAAVSLGVLYQTGTGVTQDFAVALRLFGAAADAGHPRGQNNLGLLYVRGTGVAQDYTRAAELFTAAADAGLRPAMSNLATLYANGFGVPLDEDRADALFRQAGNAEADSPAPDLMYDQRLAPPVTDADSTARRNRAAQAGDPVALFQIGWLLLQPNDPPLDPAARLRADIAGATALRQAAERGHGPAMANLGVLHFQGRGVLQDYEQGQSWLLLAQAAEVPRAQTLLDHFGPRLTVEQTNAALTRAAARHARP